MVLHDTVLAGMCRCLCLHHPCLSMLFWDSIEGEENGMGMSDVSCLSLIWQIHVDRKQKGCGGRKPCLSQTHWCGRMICREILG